MLHGGIALRGTPHCCCWPVRVVRVEHMARRVGWGCVLRVCRRSSREGMEKEGWGGWTGTVIA